MINEDKQKLINEEIFGVEIMEHTDEIVIIESENHSISNQLTVFYGVSTMKNLHLVFKINNLEGVYQQIELNNLFTDQTLDTKGAITYVDSALDFFDTTATVNLLIEFNDDYYKLIKPDGLCGLRAIYMCRKYLELKNKGQDIEYHKCDVDLSKESEYNDFFYWIKSKYDYAIRVLEDFRKYCVTNKVLDDFATNKTYIPSNDHDLIIKEYKKNCIYKMEWNHHILYEFINWYNLFDAHIKKYRKFNQIKNLRVAFLKRELWFDSTYTPFMCFNENFDLLLFTKQPISIENPNYNSDYYNLQELLLSNNKLAILSETTASSTLFNFRSFILEDILNGSKKLFGIFFGGDHFYPIDLPSIESYEQARYQIATNIIFDYITHKNMVKKLYDDNFNDKIHKLTVDNIPTITKVVNSKYEKKIDNYIKEIKKKEKENNNYKSLIIKKNLEIEKLKKTNQIKIQKLTEEIEKLKRK